ncbi:unnamed protein product [Owenia fusiformis]|uniref:Uncharacterized protein n=1 Tax=Owenia fusiformis TaxID=6347 RepID=A0A8J1TV73_OWEFU|nr:unnamed protein product [Owenia fusiformis]
MKPHIFFPALALIAALFITLWTTTDSQGVVIGPELGTSGYKLQPEPSYMIIAPRRIYPYEVVQVSVSILDLRYKQIYVRCSIRKDRVEYAGITQRFDRVSTQMIQMLMPENARPGNYTLRIEGTQYGNEGGMLFVNETAVLFDVKQASVFIQTNKPVYRQGQDVLFRVVPVTPNLMARSGSLDVYAVDPTGTEVRRWLAMQTNAGGVLEMVLNLADQPPYGHWSIRVDAFGSSYKRSFLVEEFYLPRFYVNVSMPPHIMEDSFGIGGVITANRTSGSSVQGRCHIKVQVRDPNLNYDPRYPPVWPTTYYSIPYFEARSDIFFSMEQLRRLVPGGNMVAKEVHVNVSIYDFAVQENKTGWASTLIYGTGLKLNWLGDHVRTFKPEMLFTVHIVAKKHDGSPVTLDRYRLITISRRLKTRGGGGRTFPEIKLPLPDSSVLTYEFLPEKEAESYTIKAWWENDRSTEIELTAHRHYSPTDNYISIISSTLKPQVDRYMIFTVFTTTYVEKVYYLISSKGNIVHGDVLHMSSRQKTFSVALSRDMSPQARIVAYYIKFGEVVTDGMNFFVDGSNLNPVTVTFNKGKDFTYDTIEIIGKTDPGSYIGFSGLDYDLYKRGARTFITENDIMEELSTYDDHVNSSYKHTWKGWEDEDRHEFYPAGTYGIDANTTFYYAGLVVFTDANVTRLPHECNETMGWLPCYDGTCYRVEKKCDEYADCLDRADEMGCTYNRTTPYPLTTPFERMKRITRHYEETGSWLWLGHFAKPNGQVELKVELPKEPMSWVVGAFSMSREKGLGVMQEPARFQATRPFYIQVEMPELVVKGEMIGIRVAVFNYHNEYLEALVTLHRSPDYRYVIVEEFGIVSSYAPRLGTGDLQTLVYVEPGEYAYVHMPVLPIKDNFVDVTVSATSFIGGDSVTKRMHIIYDGVTNYYNTPYLIDLISQGSLIIPDLEIPVPEQFVVPEQREHRYVPGSPRAFVNIVGDVVGPGLFKDYINAEDMLRRPFGCGEQSAFNFAANLYYLKFLKATNQLEPNVTTKALTYMNIAYQRIMSYMNVTDNSFHVFRDQNTTSGAFEAVGPLYDRKMVSNRTMTGPDMDIPTYKNISLTAYVLISLIENSGVTGIARSRVESAKTLAVKYLNDFVQDISDPLQMALVTYALDVANSVKRNDAFKRLEAMKIENEFAYWASVEIPMNPTKIINTVPFHLPRKEYANEAHAVAATSYALLVYMRNNRMREATPIVKWLQTMRNSIGGFAATQDSIIALEALTKYGEADTNRDLYNMEINLESTASPDWKRTVRLNKDNFAKLQRLELPQDKIYGSVKAVAQGTGMALMQLETHVNVEYDNLLKQAELDAPAFDIIIDDLKFSGRNFSIMEMRPCARWKRMDIANQSGMAVMEIHIPTGYVVMNDDLRAYVQSKNVSLLKRAEYYARKVVFYFDSLNSTYTCVDFRADRWFPVANVTIQNMMRVYDYYETGLHNTTLYTTYNLFNLHMCQVCGSFQCPYCPGYNTAGMLSFSLVFSILSVLLGYLTQRHLLNS